MCTKPSIQAVADILEEIIFETNEESLQVLTTAVRQYKEKYSESLRHLQRIPGFKKIWDAIETGMNEANIVRDIEEEPKERR